MAEHVYVAERASGFNFTVILPSGKKKGKDTRYRVRFEKGQFKTDDDKLAAAIDELLAESVGIRRNCRKTDKQAALALALKHKKMMQRTGAVKGGVTAGAAKSAMDTALYERDLELHPQHPDADAFAEEGLQLTETAEEPVASEPEKPVTIQLGGGQ